MVIKRNRFKHNLSLEERLIADSERALEKAKKLPPGPKRNALLQRAKQNDAAVALSAFLRPPPDHAETAKTDSTRRQPSR